MESNLFRIFLELFLETQFSFRKFYWEKKLREIPSLLEGEHFYICKGDLTLLVILITILIFSNFTHLEVSKLLKDFVCRVDVLLIAGTKSKSAVETENIHREVQIIEYNPCIMMMFWCCPIPVDSAMVASQNGFCSYKLSIHKKTNIMEIMTKIL